MKFVVLIWAVFQMFSLTTSNTNSTTESQTLINSVNIAKPGCYSRCGDLIVPYPFGLGDNPKCYIDKRFRIDCNTSVIPPKASFSKENYVSIKNISDSTIRTSNIVSSACYSPNGTDLGALYSFYDYFLTPCTLSNVNKFTVIGCHDYAWLTANTKSRNVSIGSMVFCSTAEEVVGDQCNGNGCVQSPIPQDINRYSINILNLQELSYNLTHNRSFNTCAYAFVGEENAFNFKGVTDLNDTSFIERIEDTVPIVLEWAIGNLNCSQVEATNGYACHSNSKCVSSKRGSGGYRCVCKDGYEGNPYLSPG